jgi:hypothetical protein
MSATGQYQSACYYSQNIRRSSNYGNTWAATGITGGWRGISVSSTGEYQTCGNYGVGISISSDYGINWSSRASALNWVWTAMSADGKYQTAIIPNNNIYISADYGNSWAPTASSRNWYRVAMSGTGQYQTALVISGYQYISSDYGNNWIEKTALGTPEWRSLSISYTGQYQTAGIGSGPIYVSADYGNNWTSKATSLVWYGLAMTADGKYNVGVVYGDGIYTSSSSTILYTFNLENGTTFFLGHPVPSANYTANFTITTLNTERTYLIMLINNTSSAASYYCTSVSINGTSISTFYSVAPTLTSAVVTCQEISLFYNSSASAWQADSLVKNYQAA